MLSFCLMNIAVRKAEQHVRPLEGAFLSQVSNTAMYLLMAPFILSRGGLPPLAAEGVGFFLLAGFTSNFLGLTGSFMATSLIGPSRTSAVRATQPVYALFLAYIFLRELPVSMELLGVAMVAGGMVILALDKARGPLPMSLAPTLGAISPAVLGMSMATVAAVAHATGGTLRKAGMFAIPHAYIGAFIGTAAAVLIFLVLFGLRRQLGGIFRLPAKGIGYSFLAGIFNGLALLALFSALSRSPVAVVLALTGIQPLFTIPLAYAFFGRSEALSLRLIGSVLLVVAGGTLLFVF